MKNGVNGHEMEKPKGRFCRSLVTSAQTIFLDNQEEYTTMKNSG